MALIASLLYENRADLFSVDATSSKDTSTSPDSLDKDQWDFTETCLKTFKPDPLPVEPKPIPATDQLCTLPSFLLEGLADPCPPISSFETLFTLTPVALKNLEEENVVDAIKEVSRIRLTLSLQLVSIRSNFPPAREKDIALASFFYHLTSALKYLNRNDREEDGLFEEALKLVLRNFTIVKNYLERYNRVEQITPMLDRFINFVTSIRSKRIDSDERSAKRFKT